MSPARVVGEWLSQPWDVPDELGATVELSTSAVFPFTVFVSALAAPFGSAMYISSMPAKTLPISMCTVWASLLSQYPFNGRHNITYRR